MALSIDIILNARDEASGHVEKFGKGLRETTKSIQAAAGSLISELSPALGSMVASMTSAARVAAQLPTVLGAVTVGVAATTAAFVPYVAVLVEMRRRQVDLNLAVQGLDFQGVSAQAKAAARDFAQFDNTLLGFIRTLTRTEGAFNVLDFLSGRKALEAFRKELEAAAAALAPLESARLSAEGFLKQNEALKEQLQLRQDLAREAAGEQDFLETANQLALALQRQADAQERLLRSRAAIRLATPGVTTAERALIEQERELDLLALREQTRARLGLLGFRTRQGALAIREQRLPPSGLAAGEAPEGEGGEGGLTAAGIARATATVRAADERAIQAELTARQTLLAVQKERVGLSHDELAALRVQEISLERVQMIETARGKANEELVAATADTVAQHKLLNLELERAAQTDPLEGLRLGLQEVGQEFTSLGTLMRQGIREVGSSMARNFSDTFVAVVTRDFKRLQDLPKEFGLSILRTFADIGAQLAVGGIFRQLGVGGGLRGFLPGVSAFGGGSGVTLAQTVALQAQGVQLGAGTTFAPFQAGTGQLLAPPAGGGFGLPPLPLSFLPQPSFLSAPFFLGSGVQTGLVGAEEAFQGASLLGTGAVSFGTALTAAAGFAGLGLTIFSGLTGGPPTPLSVISGTASGALSGALIGSVVPGIGTAVGAIAGGILGGGAALFGKGPGKKKMSAAARSAAAGEAGAQALSNAISGASTLERMVEILNTDWGPHGEVHVLVRLHSTKGQMWIGDFDDPSPFRWTVADVLDPEVAEKIEVEVGQTGAPSPRADLTQQLRDKILQLQGQAGGALVAFEEVFTPQGVTRITIRRATPLPELAGKDLMVLEESLSGLSDEAKISFLKELVRLDVDHDLRLIRVDPAVRLPITVGSVS